MRSQPGGPTISDAKWRGRFLLSYSLRSFKIKKGIFLRCLFSEEKVPRDGIEPPTRGFSVPCSTD